MILLFNYIFYKYYVDPTDNYFLASITFTLSMSVGLLCVLLVPIDIFLTTYKHEKIDKIVEIIKFDTSFFQQIMFSNIK